MAYEAVKDIHPSAAETATGNSGPQKLPAGTNLILAVDITAVGGDADETMDLAIQWSPDGTLFMVPEVGADIFGQMTQPEGAQTALKSFTILASWYQVVWTLAGTTPSFTFSIDQYVT